MSISLEVWGDLALFLRPEMKVERVSYDVITPSAARGLIEAIMWHPGLRWVIDRIQVCAPIQFTNIRRNEAKDVISARAVKTVMERRTGELYLAAPESIQQRAAMVLRDVRYVIDAHFEMTDKAAPIDNVGKFQEMTRRRIEKGQFYHQPCFGVREFPAHFRLCEERPPCPDERLGEKDLGWMLLDMEIIRPSYDRYETIPLWAMLRETVNPNTRDKTPNPVMSGATARAIFTGGSYPASLLEQTMLRIRSERNITRGKAAIIKAYYLRNPNDECPKEVLTVALNEASTNTAYTLGRLFSVYEAVQEAAAPDIYATIKYKYFNSAAATPATTFPILSNLCQKYLRKLDTGMCIWFERQIAELKGILGEEYPARMTLPQQGAFDLGYYHQTQKRFEKKEEQ